MTASKKMAPKGKKPAAFPQATSKSTAAKKQKVCSIPQLPLISSANKQQNPLIEKRPRNYGIGQDIQPQRNVGRMVRWPAVCDSQHAHVAAC